MDWIRLYCIGLGLVGLDWIGLNWIVELDWIPFPYINLFSLIHEALNYSIWYSCYPNYNPDPNPMARTILLLKKESNRNIIVFKIRFIIIILALLSIHY